MEKVQCYFLNKDDAILFVRDDAITFVVEEADLELDCSFPIDTQKPISKGMKIGFYDIDDKLVFYEIRTVEEDAISMTTAIYAEHALIPEMLEDPITDIRASAATASEALAAVLSGTRWQVRNSIDTQRASCRFWYINRWEALKLIREKWQIAFSFSWEINGSEIVSRYVDIISKEPVNRGKRFDTLKDISALKVHYDDTETCTALYGRGADEKTDTKDQDEQGNTYDHKISFASVVWSTQSGDPANKPSGQQYVEDVQATAIYGRSGRMRARFIDFSNCTDPAELLRLTWNALQLVNKPKVTIKATVADLEKIWGYKHEAVRLNDWGLVIADSTMTQIETTVVDVKRDYINPQQTKITLGNKVITISDIQAEYQAHTRKVEEEARRAGGAASAASEKIDQTQQELRLEFAGAQSAIYSSLYMTAEELEIEFTSGISDLHSQIHVTAEELKTEFQKSESKIYSSIRQTAEDLQVEFGSVDSDLYSTIHASAEALQTEFHKSNSAIYSTILQTAQTLETEFGDAVSDLHSSISQTAESIQTELHTAQSAIYSYVVQTAEGMEAEFGNSLSGAYAYIAASADEIKTELHTSQSSVYSSIRQTAEGLQTEFGNTVSGVYASISASASELKTEFSKADSKIYGAIKTSADGIKAEFGNALSGVYSSISASADEIKSELHTSESSIYSEISQTASGVRMEFGNALSGVYSSISSTASSLQSEFHSADSSIYSKITQTKNTIETELHSTESSLRSSIKQEADRISLVVEGTGTGASVKSAAIVGAITNSGGYLTSSIKIDADQVFIGNETSTTVIAGKCSLADVTADYIAGKIATLSTLSVGAISATGNIVSSGGVVMAPYIYLGTTGSTKNVANAIWALRITQDGDTYKLQSQSFGSSSWSDVGTFSRATDLTGAWASGKFTVNASPQGDSYWTEIVQGSATRDGNAYTVPIVASDSGSGGNTYATGRSVYVDASQVYTDGYDDGWDEARAKVVPPAQAASGEVTSFTFKAPSATKDEQQTYTFSIQKGATPSGSGYASVALSGTVVGRISIGDWYTSGYNDGKPVSGTAGGRTSGVSALVHDFTITKGDGTTATLQINVSNIYATARTGYTYGTFTPASVTLQGSQDSVYVEASSGGTDYYQADTAKTYYEAGTAETYYDGDGGSFTVQGESEVVYPGNGTSGYLRGSTVTVTKQGSSVSVHTLGTVHYYVRHASSETPTTAWYTRQSSRPSSGQYNVEYQDGGSSTYYNAGSDVTYYKGDGSYVYGRGSSMTRYKAGTVTKYDRGNAVSVMPVGSSVSVTPVKASTKKNLLSTIRYKAGSTVTDTYYTKS